MLNGMDKRLTGDLLKILCDMGHGDTIVIADANFPAERIGKRVIRMSGMNGSELLAAILPLFPLDVAYTDHPACVMQITDSDRARGMARPPIFDEFERILAPVYGDLGVFEIERFHFYDVAKEAFAVIQTGEERIYGNLILTKGCVL